VSWGAKGALKDAEFALTVLLGLEEFVMVMQHCDGQVIARDDQVCSGLLDSAGKQTVTAWVLVANLLLKTPHGAERVRARPKGGDAKASSLQGVAQHGRRRPKLRRKE
jgi:hypothetical protein